MSLNFSNKFEVSEVSFVYQSVLNYKLTIEREFLRC